RSRARCSGAVNGAAAPSRPFAPRRSSSPPWPCRIGARTTTTWSSSWPPRPPAPGSGPNADSRAGRCWSRRWGPSPRGPPRGATPAQGRRPAGRRGRVIARVRADEAAVAFTEDPLVALAADKRPALADPASLRSLERRGDPRAVRVVERVARAEYPLVVLN